jgi:hypothetical protein
MPQSQDNQVLRQTVASNDLIEMSASLELISIFGNTYSLTRLVVAGQTKVIKITINRPPRFFVNYEKEDLVKGLR